MIVLNYLFKHTQLQDTFGIIMLALVNNEPKVMNLRKCLFTLYKSSERCCYQANQV
jgi:DNA gyrase subunit A